MNKHNHNNAGIGVGYVTVIIIFAVICLTVFAVLSFRAAGSNDALNERAGYYLKEYYAADMSAKEVLFRLDEIAESSRNTPFFAESFEEEAQMLDKVSVKSGPDGATAEFVVEINERQSIFASVTFYESKKEYKINVWRSVTSSDGEDSGLNVWDGRF